MCREAEARAPLKTHLTTPSPKQGKCLLEALLWDSCSVSRRQEYNLISHPAWWMSRRPLRPSPHGRSAWCGSAAAYIVQWGRGSAVHLSKALELISVQINCFSCILVTGISLYLSGLLGGRRGDVCECVYWTLSPAVKKKHGLFA